MSRRAILAVDVGNFEIKGLAIAEEKDSLNLVGKVSSKSEGLSKGEIQDVEALRKRILEVTSKLYELPEVKKRKDIELIFLVSSNNLNIDIAVETLNFTESREVTEADIEKMKLNIKEKYKEEGKNVLDLKPMEFMVDEKVVKNPVAFNVKENLSAKMNVVWVPENSFATLKSVLKGVIEGEALIYDSTLVSAYAVSSPTDRDLGVGVIDLGHSKARMIIFKDGIPRFYVDFDLGMEYVIKDIMKVLQTTEKEAFRLLKEHAQCLAETKIMKKIEYEPIVDQKYAYTSQNLLNKIVFARVREILNKLNSDLAKLEYEHPRDFSGGIRAGFLLTGGGAKIKNIESTFNEIMASHGRIGTAHADGVIYVKNAEEVYNDPSYSPIFGAITFWYTGLETSQIVLEEEEEKISVNPTSEKRRKKKKGFLSKLSKFLLGGSEDAV